jgi:methionyl aminopeptidase
MISVKTAEEIEILREGGRHLAAVLDAVEEAVRPGVSTLKLDQVAEDAIRALGDTPLFLGYQPLGAPRPFPATLCIAPNDVVVHGIPTEHPRVLQDGDIIGIDTGLRHNGLVVDSGRTVPVGKIDSTAEKLIAVTKEALMRGIAAAKPGGTVGDIGHAIESYVRGQGFSIVEVFCGHGLGYEPHEEPSIPNFGRAGTGAKLKSGMVLAIEPMLNEGTKEVKFDRDGYTARTRDGMRSAHFEHTVVITESGAEILTTK